MIGMRVSTVQPCNLHSPLTPPPPHNTNSFPHFLPLKPHFSTSLCTSSFNSIFKQRGGFCVFALKKRRKDSNVVAEMEVSDDDDFEYDDFENDDNENEDGEEEDEGIIIPLENMKRWLENKPTGFGEGKAYDTSVEDKLFEEIEQSKVAQLANVNKLKHNPIPPNSKGTNQKKEKVPEVIKYSGICVRLSNLPKKKNIHKNLQLAFKGVPGINNIVPAVLGNEKTRDPVCKGFGFVYFRSEQDANKFVNMFSTQSIAFGKVQKQIKCEIMKSQSDSSDIEESSNKPRTDPKKRLPVIETKSATPDLNVSKKIVSIDSNHLKDEPIITAEWKETTENPVSLSSSELNSNESIELEVNSPIESLSSKSTLPEQKKIRPVDKKAVDKRKGGKTTKLTIPGSANRLKMKEKAVLTGVLAKYAEKSASGSRKG